MNPKAVETFSTIGVGVLCVVLGIVTLAIFLTVLSLSHPQFPAQA